MPINSPPVVDSGLRGCADGAGDASAFTPPPRTVHTTHSSLYQLLPRQQQVPAPTSA
eukprot:COSAG01_NODE_11827_length_1851_cov_14.312785_1_plen_56_part_10